jgi:hypothetical protein
LQWAGFDLLFPAVPSEINWKMIKNFFKIMSKSIQAAWFSLINIDGLAIGGKQYLILLWIQNEISYDRFHIRATGFSKCGRSIRKVDGVLRACASRNVLSQKGFWTGGSYPRRLGNNLLLVMAKKASRASEWQLTPALSPCLVSHWSKAIPNSTSWPLLRSDNETLAAKLSDQKIQWENRLKSKTRTISCNRNIKRPTG